MTYFGKIESFDEHNGHGVIMPENGGKEIGFERSAISWERRTPPLVGQRLSYELSETGGAATAVNIQNA